MLRPQLRGSLRSDLCRSGGLRPDLRRSGELRSGWPDLRRPGLCSGLCCSGRSGLLRSGSGRVLRSFELLRCP